MREREERGWDDGGERRRVSRAVDGSLAQVQVTADVGRQCITRGQAF